MAKIVLSGFREFQGKLKKLASEVMEEIDREVQDAAEQWEHLAKDAAPVDQARLQQGISSYKIKGGWEIVSSAEYSAYIEWGTKKKVKVPAKLKAYAAQFKGKGTAGGRFNLQKLLYAWMDRVGIPEEFQWLVYIQIIVEGIEAQPFFFIQRPKVEKSLVQNIKKVLKTPH